MPLVPTHDDVDRCRRVRDVPQRLAPRASAVALSGISIAAVVGIPLGTFLESALVGASVHGEPTNRPEKIIAGRSRVAVRSGA
ncbi:hypothetical protein ACIBXA_12025 [Micromonospora echinaurantiaca]|uniref:hypothetical protein n=1 Tax=Micromonospora echinaurantiaca TaxID=47857 RepID=UPI00379FE581